MGALLFPITFALALSVSRLSTLVYFGSSAEITDLIIPFIFLVGVGYGFLVLANRSRVLFGLLLLPFITVQVIAFHYQAVYDSLPGVNVFYYLSEFEQLAPSISGVALNLSLFGQIFCLSLLLWLLPLSQSVSTVGIGYSIGFLAVLLTGFVLQLGTPLTGIADARRADPIFWAIRTTVVDNPLIRPEAQGDQFLALHGFPGESELGFPGCSQRPTTASADVEASPIVVIMLESISIEDMLDEVDGTPVMPNLQRLRTENLSFPNFVAAGSKSVQSLVATYSGMPAHPLRILLHQYPLPNFDGVPRALAGIGYQTAYFHGADLHFENQDRYLRAVGFSELHSRHPNKPHPVRGWGYDDAVMFGEIRQWLSERQGPRFASLATLSTHDPFMLPEDWVPVFDTERQDAARLEAKRFSDYHLGLFVDWFLAEYPDGVLLITADHPLPADLKKQPAALEVPMMIAGTDPITGERYQGLDARRASHYDLAATISELVGLSGHCGLGVSLLAKDERERSVYSVIGHDLEKLQLYIEDEVLVLARLQGEVTVFSESRRQSFMVSDLPPLYDELLGTLISGHHELLASNGYFPEASIVEAPAAIAPIRPEDVLLVSHRGNLSLHTETVENSFEALELVSDAELRWVELDLQFTADNQLVLYHDPVIETPEGPLQIGTLSHMQLNELVGRNIPTLRDAITRFKPKLNFLLELKTPSDVIYRQLEMAEALVKIINETGINDEVIVDSFSRYMASFVKERCNCDVGFDAPFGKPLNDSELADIASSLFDWVYVHHTVYDSALVRNAHALGLKVMVYTVNEPAVVAGWRGEAILPDGILTDNLAVQDALR